MDSNNWRQPSQTEQPPMDGAGGEWRAQLPPDSRSRIVNKIMETLKRHLPSSGHEGVQELKKIAMRLEEKIYHAATNQSDYLRRISLKMLKMESKSNPTSPMPNAIPSNSPGMSRNPQDPGSQSMQPQVQDQSQSLPIPMTSNQPTVQGRPQLLTQNIQSGINNNAGVQSSATALPTVNSLAKNNMPNVMQNSNMQNMSGISQSSMGNTMVQGVASNIYNSQKQQMQGRQNMQQVGFQQQIQQPQNQQQFLYQQQLMKQKLQQNNLLPSSQLQSSQQPVMQNLSVMQSPMLSGLQQNQPSSIQQSSQSVHQQHQQPVLRQQQQQGQQAPVHHQQMSQQPMLQSQEQQQQQHLMGQQHIEQQNSMPDIQQQQQPQRMLSQQNNLTSMSGQQQSSQNLQPQQLMGQQSSLSSMHQQQLSSQTHAGTLPQQQQMFGSQSGNSSMPTIQHLSHMLQQSKVMAQQQNPNSSALLSGGGQQQMMPQVQSQMQLQQHNMQQRLQTPNALLQQQNGIDPQKMFQSHRTPAKAPYSSLDSTEQTCNSDAQEEVYQKLKVMKDLYFVEMHDIYQKICLKLQQHETSLSQQAKVEAFERLKVYKQMIERILQILQLSKSNSQHFHKSKLPSLEKQILQILNTHRPKKPGPPLQPGQIPPTHMQSLQQNQQPHSQIPQNQSLESGVNSQLQSVNVQGSSVSTMQPGDMSGLHGSVSLSGITSSQQNMIQPGSNLGSGQGNAPISISQVAAGSVQHNPVSAAQQANSQTGMNLLHLNMNSLQPNSNLLQSQHLKQQEQQLKQQFQSRHIQQQLLQQQQQQQQLHMQQIKQQPGQMQGHQMPQLHRMNDVRDIKPYHRIDLPGDGFSLDSRRKLRDYAFRELNFFLWLALILFTAFLVIKLVTMFDLFLFFL